MRLLTKSDVPSERAVFSTRISPTVIADLRALAIEDRRSLAQELSWLVERERLRRRAKVT
jgi:hypothetical protein